MIKYLGAAYLVYLGLRAILQRPKPGSVPSAVSITAPEAFRQAGLAEVLNPKSALFFLAFLPQFVDPGTGSVALQLTVLGVFFVLMGLVGTVAVAIFTGKATAFLRSNSVVLRWQGRAIGTIYCALGLRLALQER